MEVNNKILMMVRSKDTEMQSLGVILLIHQVETLEHYHEVSHIINQVYDIPLRRRLRKDLQNKHMSNLSKNSKWKESK